MGERYPADTPEQFDARGAKAWRGVAERVQKDRDRLREALARLSSTEAFWTATTEIDPELHLRMFYAQAVLNGEEDPMTWAREQTYAANKFYRETEDQVAEFERKMDDAP